MHREEDVPLPGQEGWMRHQENAAEPPLKGADGVVSCGECCSSAFAKHFVSTDHPVCAFKGGYAKFS
jgi:hypothetical protein